MTQMFPFRPCNAFWLFATGVWTEHCGN